MKGEVTLADRVAQLVKDVDQGKIRRAAKRLGLPHPTLVQIIGGAIPRTATLQKLAKGYDVPLEWLLTGRGPGPRDDGPSTGEEFEYFHFIRDRGFDPETTVMLLALPATVGFASFWLASAAAMVGAVSNGKDGDKLRERITRDARRYAAQAWLAMFSTLLDRVGPTSFREIILSNLEMIAFGYSTLGSYLIAERVISGGEDLHVHATAAFKGFTDIEIQARALESGDYELRARDSEPKASSRKARTKRRSPSREG